MTQIFDDAGAAVPVTLIEAGPCYVTQVRKPEIDGYSAIQLGFGETKPKSLTGGQLGHLKRNNLQPLRFLREFREKNPEVKEGDPVTVNVFQVGDHVDVVGNSKGKGFQGGVQRYHFKGGIKTHGQSDRQHAPGSRGSGTTPGRVFNGARSWLLGQIPSVPFLGPILLSVTGKSLVAAIAHRKHFPNPKEKRTAPY